MDKKADYKRRGNHVKNEPDVIYEYENHELGIEITTAYFEEYQANQQWEIMRNGWGDKKSVDLLTSNGPFFGDRSLEAIQNSINDKCTKNHKYDGVEVKWLLVWDDTIFTDKSDIINIVKKITIPDCIFEHMYIISFTQEAHNFELFQIK